METNNNSVSIEQKLDSIIEQKKSVSSALKKIIEAIDKKEIIKTNSSSKK